MWPLWSDRWDGLRQQLGLTGAPLEGTGRLPRPSPLLYTISPSLVPQPPYWPAAVQVLGFIFDEPTAHHDGSAVTGTRRAGEREDDAVDSAAGCSEARPSGVPRWLCELLGDLRESGADVARGGRPLYVGFGSSSEILTIARGGAGEAGGSCPAEAVLASVLGAARRVGCALLLHCCGCR